MGQIHYRKTGGLLLKKRGSSSELCRWQEHRGLCLSPLRQQPACDRAQSPADLPAAPGQVYGRRSPKVAGPLEETPQPWNTSLFFSDFCSFDFFFFKKIL